jgi:hypothetical protein
LSLYAKNNGRRFLYLNANTAFGARSTFDLQSGVISETTAGTAKIETLPNGWYRCSVSGTAATTQTTVWFGQLNNAGVATDTVYTGDGTSGLFFWGAQVEAGAYPTTYIPTTTAAVTRLADACSVTGVADLIGQAEGTLFLDFEKTNNDNTGTGGYFRIDVNNGTTNNRILFGFDLNKVNATVVSGTLVALIETATTRTQERIKAAFAYKANDFVLYVNGVQIGTDTSGSVPTGLANFQWGVNQTTATTTSGVINQQALFTSRLSNAELQALTTL